MLRGPLLTFFFFRGIYSSTHLCGSQRASLSPFLLRFILLLCFLFLWQACDVNLWLLCVLVCVSEYVGGLKVTHCRAALMAARRPSDAATCGGRYNGAMYDLPHCKPVLFLLISLLFFLLLLLFPSSCVFFFFNGTKLLYFFFLGVRVCVCVVWPFAFFACAGLIKVFFSFFFVIAFC